MLEASHHARHDHATDTVSLGSMKTCPTITGGSPWA
jgi:hypothetical protein